ncbi:hypothetical protein PCASD_04590 [Puccinia coronata f. sp. avenae]|uniref:Uncharacterized protein n=1 Tax=Puccinia coronata f. sp. avenae TaxID=200324 RepID=A0A2N5SQF7_9BASI|nr:hypothetical protein PCASD_20367 [Puccinia coronata f. sp. avenae]PLW45109.1 hypothetical protein PCASD_04590 [Puccinia coronata f. sp. avenae]
MRSSLLKHVVVGTFFLVKCTSGHAFILAIDGGNKRRSTGFGTRLTARGNLVQNSGIILQKEITAGETTPCGRIFGGDGLKAFVIDVAQELASAELDGVPSANEDGSVSMGVYVHNPDGSGPYTCEYSSDATLQQLQPMPITTQIEGEKGTNPAAKDFVYPLVAKLPNDAICRGGTGGDTCIMRCINPLGFGSCAAIKRYSPPNQSGGSLANSLKRRSMILDQSPSH